MIFIIFSPSTNEYVPSPFTVDFIFSLIYSINANSVLFSTVKLYSKVFLLKFSTLLPFTFIIDKLLFVLSPLITFTVYNLVVFPSSLVTFIFIIFSPEDKFLLPITS